MHSRERLLVMSVYTLSFCLPATIVVSAYRYIATATLAITAVFLEYLRQFLIDLHQILRPAQLFLVLVLFCYSLV